VTDEHLLASCDERIRWAESQLETMKDSLSSYDLDPDAGTDPLMILDVDYEGGRLRIRAARDAVVPMHLRVLVGHILHDLHSALDNLAFALGSIEGKISGRDRDSAFPILTDANLWFTEETRRKIKFIRPRDRTLIEMYQPFMHSNPGKHTFARIRELSNQDKHRGPNLMAAATAGALVDSIEQTHCRVVIPDLDTQKPFRKNTVLLSGTIEDVGADPYVHMKGGFRWYPIFDDGEPVQSFVEIAIAKVNDMITAARPSFET
jgi:hypothetical protein